MVRFTAVPSLNGLNCIHSLEFERVEGYEGQRVNIGGRVFEL